MRRALRRAAQVFVAAGAIGLVSPAWAQTSHAGDKSAPAHAPKMGEMSSADLATLDVMQVELAWLANKATFHHTLRASVIDGSLEVRGYVPNTAVKEQALRVAGEHTSLPVVDHVQINANVVIPIGGGPVAELTQKATKALADSLGDKANALEITAGDNGVVTIKGTVGSVEEKLAISRKMRQVSGCAAVVNQLSVKSVVRGGRRVAPLTADGAQVLAQAAPKAAPTTSVLPEPAAPVKPARATQTAPLAAAPVAVPPAPVKPSAPPPAVAVVAAPPSVTPALVGPLGSQHLTPSPTTTTTVVKPTVSPSIGGAITTPVTPPVISKPATGSIDAAKAPDVLEKKTAPPPPLIITAAPDKSLPEIVSVSPPGPLVVSKPFAAVGDAAKPPDVKEKKPTPPGDKPADAAISTNPPAPLGMPKSAAASLDVAKVAEKKPTQPLAPLSAGWRDKPAAAKDGASSGESGALVDGPKQVAVAATPVEPTARTVVPDKPATPSTPWAAQSTATVAKPSASVVETPVHNAPNGGKWPAAHEEKPLQVAYVTTGTVTFDDDLTPPPAPSLKPMPSPTPAAPTVKAPLMPSPVPAGPTAPVVKSAPATTTPTSASPPSPKPVTVPMTPTDPLEPLPNSAASKLRHEVEIVCGKQAREVQVVLKADKMMHVKVKVNDHQSGVALTDKILRLPAMATPNVRLEMEVMDKK